VVSIPFTFVSLK